LINTLEQYIFFWVKNTTKCIQIREKNFTWPFKRGVRGGYGSQFTLNINCFSPFTVKIMLFSQITGIKSIISYISIDKFRGVARRRMMCMENLWASGVWGHTTPHPPSVYPPSQEILEIRSQILASGTLW
jgi:hypothetical protein